MENVKCQKSCKKITTHTTHKTEYYFAVVSRTNNKEFSEFVYSRKKKLSVYAFAAASNLIIIMKTTFYTSFLFLVPTFYAWSCGLLDLAVCSAVCLLTSCLNHGIPNHPVLKPLDIVIVNSIGAWFTLQGWWRMHPYYFLICTSMAGLAMGIYLFWAVPRGGQHHEFVHFVAITGVCAYIFGVYESTK